jgi:hypothetical protein
MIIVRFGIKPSKPEDDSREEYPSHPDHDCESLLLHYASEPVTPHNSAMVRWPHRSGDDWLFFTSSANLVHAARVLHKECKIVLDSVEYETDEGITTICVDSDGRLSRWPAGFCDHMDDWLDRILGWSDDESS